MARVFDLDLTGVRVSGKDFAGSMYGPDQRQFKAVIDDPEIIEKLKMDGAPIWTPEKRDPDDPDVGYLSVKVSFRFGAPKIALITAEGNAFVFDEKNVHEVDKMWIKDADLHVHGSNWERPNGQRGVSCYLDTFVGRLLSNEERDEIMKESQLRSDPIRNKYKNIFNEG